jgi:hypothetical protein
MVNAFYQLIGASKILNNLAIAKNKPWFPEGGSSPLIKPLTGCLDAAYMTL